MTGSLKKSAALGQKSLPEITATGQIHQTMAPLHDFIFSEWVISSCSSTRLDRRPNPLGSCQHNNFSISTSKVQWSIPRSGKAVLRSLGFSCSAPKKEAPKHSLVLRRCPMGHALSIQPWQTVCTSHLLGQAVSSNSYTGNNLSVKTALFVCVITPVFSAVNM